MKVEVICIGTELLLGDVINTNASFLGKALSEIGIGLYYVTTVGDNKQRIIASLQHAFSRADIVITSGGLGPTADDLTHECIADFLGVGQDFHQNIADRLQSFFKARGREMAKSNLKQAYFPHGAAILPNPFGTAPGIIYNKDGKIILTFPGVPSELKDMWEQTARNYLSSINPEQAVIKSRTLRFIGEGESAVAEKVADFLEQANPTVAPYAGKGEVTLRITARAADEAAALAMIAPVEAEIISRLGRFYYGADQDSLISVTAALLNKQQATIASVETSTGGLLTQRFHSLPDNAFYKLSVSSTDPEVLAKTLQLEPQSLQAKPFTDQQLIGQLAERVRNLAAADYAIATGGNIADAEVIIALASAKGTEVRELKYTGWKPEHIIFMTTQAAINLLRQSLIQ